LKEILDSFKNSNAFLYISITEFGIPVAYFVPAPLKHYGSNWTSLPKDKNIFAFYFSDTPSGDFNVFAADLKKDHNIYSYL
jgi:hypothetical protein